MPLVVPYPIFHGFSLAVRVVKDIEGGFGVATCHGINLPCQGNVSIDADFCGADRRRIASTFFGLGCYLGG
jgi:hypothetical protein